MPTDSILSVSMETVDDIEFRFEDAESADELWQVKTRIVRRGSLGNSSTDLWKTVGNWLTVSQDDENRNFVLLTADTAAPGSAALALGVDDQRSVTKALDVLDQVAQTSQNSANSSYYEKYLALPGDARRDFLNRVTVVSNAAAPTDITGELEKAVRTSTIASRRASLVERLRGWWHQRTIAHLEAVAKSQPDKIDMVELEAKLLQIGESLGDHSLPIDFEFLPEPPESEVDADKRIFVAQMRAIRLHPSHVRDGVSDFNRASEQRLKWAREDLLIGDELDRYDRRLIEKWKRFFLPYGEEDESALDEKQKEELGRKRFEELSKSDLPRIRELVLADFVAHGSLHLLADDREIGWHPDWEHLFQADRSSQSEVSASEAVNE